MMKLFKISINLVQFASSEFFDIPYSFLIGGDGVIYEGRGLFYTPATALG